MATEARPINRVDISSIHMRSDATTSPPLNKDLDVRAFGRKAAREMNNPPGTANDRLEYELGVADEGEEVNEMLIDAIKAKLAILDEMDR